MINPKPVNEQICGAFVQGIGGALFEECRCDENGHLLNGSMVNYLVPMAGQMLDIEVVHLQTLTRSLQLGAKGAGEAGTAVVHDRRPHPTPPHPNTGPNL